MTFTTVRPRVGIALGSGSSRGWAHISVLRALAELGVEPDIVCGCSVGSIVGAAYAANNLENLEKWTLSLTRLELVRFFEVNASLHGFVNREKLQQFLHTYVCADDCQIQQLSRRFATVATDLATGREVWFTDGMALEAVWASIALPGLFTPYRYHDQWLVDGGLVNPVPVSLCRALGADIVIAVNLNGTVTRRYRYHTQNGKTATPNPSPPLVVADSVVDMPAKKERLVDALAASLREYSAALLPDTSKDKSTPPSLMDSIATSINIMQDKITRSRMAGDPPDILLSPRLEHIGLLEFFRATEAIEEGRKAVERMQAEIRDLLSA